MLIHTAFLSRILSLTIAPAVLFGGCTQKTDRQPMDEGPVASPTTTATPQASASGPEVPFDGGRPEDLQPMNTPQEMPQVHPEDHMADHVSTERPSKTENPTFNIYEELLKGTLSCAEGGKP